MIGQGTCGDRPGPPSGPPPPAAARSLVDVSVFRDVGLPAATIQHGPARPGSAIARFSSSSTSGPRDIDTRFKFACAFWTALHDSEAQGVP